MEKPTYIERIEWKGIEYVLEFFKTYDFSEISPKKQSSAVCFPDNENVVLYQHVQGYIGLPGGTIEQGEAPEDALKREILEEVTCEILKFGPFGYFKTYKVEEPETTWYQLRYWAKVNCLDETPDPDGKALHRVIVPYSEASYKLGWGERGKLLFEIAREEFISNTLKSEK